MFLIRTLKPRQMARTCQVALSRFIQAMVGCVEQAQVSVRRRSQEMVLHPDGVSPAPEAACADTPWILRELDTPYFLPAA